MDAPSQILKSQSPYPNFKIDLQDQLVQENAIRKLLPFIAICIDNRQYSAIPQVFADDVVADFRPKLGILKSPEEIASALEKFSRSIYVHHQIGTQVITLESDTDASSVTYVIANEYGQGEYEGKSFYVTGRYETRYKKIKGLWKITVHNVIYMGTPQGDKTIQDDPLLGRKSSIREGVGRESHM